MIDPVVRYMSRIELSFYIYHISCYGAPNEMQNEPKACPGCQVELVCFYLVRVRNMSWLLILHFRIILYTVMLVVVDVEYNPDMRVLSGLYSTYMIQNTELETKLMLRVNNIIKSLRNILPINIYIDKIIGSNITFKNHNIFIKKIIIIIKKYHI